MAAPVRIEDEAFSDLRFGVLATLCHLADADHARGKMAVLWRQCTSQGVYVLPAAVVASVLGPNGCESLCSAGLGEVVDTGIRICGTRGRIEWLKKLKKNAQKGGKAKAAKRQASGNADGRAKAASALPSAFPPTLTPTLTLSPSEEGLVVPSSPAAKPSPKSRKAQVPEDWRPASHLDSWQEAELVRFRNHHRSKGNTFVDCGLAWTNWLSRASQFGNGQAQPPLGGIRQKNQIA